MTCGCSSPRVWPHDGRDRDITPRNDSAASARIARAAIRETWTMAIGAMLGITWRRTVRHVDVPGRVGGEDVVPRQHARRLGAQDAGQDDA